MWMRQSFVVTIAFLEHDASVRLPPLDFALSAASLYLPPLAASLYLPPLAASLYLPLHGVALSAASRYLPAALSAAPRPCFICRPSTLLDRPPLAASL